MPTFLSILFPLHPSFHNLDLFTFSPIAPLFRYPNSLPIILPTDLSMHYFLSTLPRSHTPFTFPLSSVIFIFANRQVTFWSIYILDSIPRALGIHYPYPYPISNHINSLTSPLIWIASCFPYCLYNFIFLPVFIEIKWMSDTISWIVAYRSWDYAVVWVDGSGGSRFCCSEMD